MMKVLKSLGVSLALLGFGVGAEAKVVINEIFYHAPNDIEDLQWVELHNTAKEAVDLSGWAFTKGIRYTFPAGTRIAAEGYVVVARDAALFRKYYGVESQGVFEKTLRRKGERIELSDAKGATADTVKFDDRSPWPSAAGGFSASMERICPEALSGLPENWASSPLPENPDQPGGTPGRRNTVYQQNLPPVISQVKLPAASPKPGEAVTLEADVEDADGVGAVSLLYRVVEPGKESAEVTVPMQLVVGHRYSATVPGIPAERLVRVRIQADDKLGNRRIHPGVNEPRPAFSWWVPGDAPASKLAVARLIHTDAKEFARTQQQQQRQGGGRGGFNEDDMLRWNIQRIVRMNVDPSTLWVALAVRPDTEAAQLASWRPLFERLIRDREALVTEKQAAADLQAALQGTMQAATALKAKFQEQLGSLLKGGQERELKEWMGGMPGGGNPNRMRGEMMLRQSLRLEPGLMALTLRDDVKPEQMKTVRDAYATSRKDREALIDVAASVRDADSFQNLNEKVSAIGDRFLASVRVALTVDQLAAMEKAGDEDRAAFSFGPGRNRSALASPVQGRSVLIWYEPGVREPKVFDFITLSDRKAGYKVRLQRDRPLNGMTGVNLIFEENERMVLAEPLALELYRAAGMPASLTDFVEVVLDGAPLGYHLLIEQPNSSFLHRNGVVDGGDIYKYLWFERGIAAQHEKKNNPHHNHEALLKLIDTLDKTSGAEQWRVIRKEFDVEEVINYFAVNMLLSHWDGFMNNYFAYQDLRETGKWMLFPWDQDKTWGVYDGIEEGEVFATMPLSFGTKDDKPPGWTKERPPKTFFETINVKGSEWWRPPGYFSGPLLSNPHFRKHFLARLRELMETQFTEEKILPKLAGVKAKLGDEVVRRARLRGEDPAAATKRFEANLESFRKFLVERRKFLLAQEELRTAGAFDRTQLK